jgi:hypothetical protein
MPGIFGRWRSEWRQRRQAVAFVTRLRGDLDEADIQWLADSATGGDSDRARWELRYARAALGLLAAERDALDDLTPSLIAREIAAALHADPRIAADKVKVAEQQFNQRLSAYRRAFMDRNATTAVSDRLGDTLLRLAGASAEPNVDARTRARALVARLLDDANTALREYFGSAILPPDVRPSLLGARS